VFVGDLDEMEFREEILETFDDRELDERDGLPLDETDDSSLSFEDSSEGDEEVKADGHWDTFCNLGGIKECRNGERPKSSKL